MFMTHILLCLGFKNKNVWHNSFSESVKIAARPRPDPFNECESIVFSVHQQKACSA